MTQNIQPSSWGSVRVRPIVAFNAIGRGAVDRMYVVKDRA